MTDAQNPASSGPGISVFGGPSDGTTLPLSPARKEYRLGSATDCDLHLDLTNVDAVHARLTVDGVRLLISDAGSATGTYVNGERSGSLHELQDGDRVSLGPPGSKGSARLLVHLPEGSFTARFPPVPLKTEGPESEPSGLAPFAGSGLRGEGPWSLLPAEVSASGLELSDSSGSVFSLDPPSSDLFSSGAGGLELSASTDSLLPSVPPPSGLVPTEPTSGTPPYGGDPSQPPFTGFGTTDPTSGETTQLVLGGDQGPGDLSLPDMGGLGAPDSLFSLPPPTLPAVLPPQPKRLEPTPSVGPGAGLEELPPPTPSLPPKARSDRPEYLTELPSIAVSDERPAAGPVRPRASESHAPTPTAPSPRRAARRRHPRFSFTPSPQLLMVLGGLVVLGLLVGAFVWLRPLFRRAPVAESASPGRVQPGQALMISGSGFDPTPSGNTVRIGTLTANVTSATPTQIAIMVPPGAAPAGPVDLGVVISTSGGSSAPLKVQVYRAPRMTAIEPDVVMPGDRIAVRGENLDGKPLVLSFSGIPAEVSEATMTTLEAVVPAVPIGPGGKATVALAVGPDSAQPTEVLIGRLPVVLAAKPPRGTAGDKVHLTGRGFSPSPEGNHVLMGTQRALVLAASPTELTVVVPGSTTAATEEVVPIQVTSNAAVSSNPLTFSVSRIATGGFVPRFFASPAPDSAGPRVALVSCELGPFFAFGAKGDDATTADRAARVAGELNAIFEQALVRKLSIEIVERPVPGVTVVGSPKPVLLLLPEDVAAYPRLQESGAGRNRPLGARALASLWAGLLKDALALFAYRERPIHMLEQSAKARAFADLYAEALRAGASGTGIPVRIVLPASPARLRTFRDMALNPAPDAGTRPGAAVEGRWEGRMEADGSRPFQVRLRMDGMRLVGTATAQSGKLSMNTPIRDASYAKGQLGFVVDLFGSPRLFTGTVAGDTISGTIERAGGDKAQLGTFTLRYVE